MSRKLTEEQKEKLRNNLKLAREALKQKRINKATEFYQDIPNQIIQIDNEMRNNHSINAVIDTFNPHPLQEHLFPFYTPYIISKCFFDDRLLKLFKPLEIENCNYINVAVPNSFFSYDSGANHIFKIKNYEEMRIYDLLLQLIPQLPIPTENGFLFINDLHKYNENSYKLKMGFEVKEYSADGDLSDDEDDEDSPVPLPRKCKNIKYS